MFPSHDLVEELEKRAGLDIIGQEAARQLTTGVSRSTASIGGLAQEALQIVISPRFVGNIAAYSGLATQKVADVVSSIDSLLTPQQKASFFDAIITGATEITEELRKDSRTGR